MMFSDNYTVHERYSLVSGERLADYSEMPWLYTPLVDERYKPTNIPVSTKNALNRIFEYNYVIAETEAIQNDDKMLGIYHNGDEITQYETRVPIKYSTMMLQRKSYMVKTGTLSSIGLYDKIDEICKKTEDHVTNIVGFEHDTAGNLTGLSVLDKDYDVSSYGSTILDNLVLFSKKNWKYCQGQLTVRENNEVTFYSQFSYQRKVTTATADEYRRNPLVVFNGRNIMNISYRQSVARHLTGYKEYGALNDQQISDILNLIPDLSKDAQIQIEHVFRGSELIDIIVDVVKYLNFEEVQQQRKWIQQFDEEGNRIW